MQVLIIGPVGTPYENGCFEFDIFLDQKFPLGPPLVTLMTTGNGSVRFNPNLYNCGKVSKENNIKILKIQKIIIKTNKKIKLKKYTKIILK
jgi:ubiquitin-protein ligase